MRLCESPEFRDAIVTAKDYFNRPGLTEQFIEKDYYVTEALRILEIGTRSGNYPITTIQLSSYLAEFLIDTGTSLGANDESSFPMQLLHFRRTFVEKLFSIHSHVTEYQLSGKPISTYARHYYDLFCLAQQPEVKEMIDGLEYQEIKQDVENISQEHFTFLHHTPVDLSFANSQALFPTGELRTLIVREYQQQCRDLCYGSYPAWQEVADTFEEMRNKL